MIRHRHGRLGVTHLAVIDPEPLESLSAGDFVNQMPVDIEDSVAILQSIDDVVVPDLIVKRTGFGHSAYSSAAWVAPSAGTCTRVFFSVIRARLPVRPRR